MSNETIFYSNGDVITAVLKLCPSCNTISKFKFKKYEDVKAYGLICIKCYSRVCNFKKRSEGYFTEYYQNNKEKINSNAKKYYNTHKMILIREHEGISEYKNKKGKSIFMDRTGILVNLI